MSASWASRTATPAVSWQKRPPAAGVQAEPPGDASDPADHAAGRDDHDRRAAALAGLRERRELYLQALGYSYGEIAALTDSTYTAVNRRVTEGRAKLRRLAAETAPLPRADSAGGRQRQSPPLHPFVDLQTIRYRGRAVAACTRERFLLAEDLRARRAGDPELTFVLFMCLYFRDVAAGQLPGPYRDADARRFARACLGLSDGAWNGVRAAKAPTRPRPRPLPGAGRAASPPRGHSRCDRR